MLIHADGSCEQLEIIECTMLEHQIGDMKMAEDRYLTFALTKASGRQNAVSFWSRLELPVKR